METENPQPGAENLEHKTQGFDMLKYIELRNQLLQSEWTSSAELKELRKSVNREAIRAKYGTRFRHPQLLELATRVASLVGEDLNSILEREAKAIEKTNAQDELHLNRLRQLNKREQTRRSSLLSRLDHYREEKKNYEDFLENTLDYEEHVAEQLRGPVPGKKWKPASPPPDTRDWYSLAQELKEQEEQVRESLDTVYLNIEQTGELIEQCRLNSLAYANQIRIIKQKIRTKHKLQIGIYSPDFMNILDNNIQIAQRAEQDERTINGKAVITKTIIETLQANVGSMLRPYSPKFTDLHPQRDLEKLRKEIESLHVDTSANMEQSKSAAEAILEKYL